MTVEHVEVWLWGDHVASLVDTDERVTFGYTPRFQTSRIELAPITMPLSPDTFSGFERLNSETFRGLPGLVADSLPDKFGQAVIDQWLAIQGRPPGSMTPVEQLRYIGSRGMGALEYRPATERNAPPDEALDIAALVGLASAALGKKESLETLGLKTEEQLAQILSVGTSAGGARAKAVIAWDPSSGEVRSGQVSDLPASFEHWLLKFDGISDSRDKEAFADPAGYGRLEYAYSLMAAEAGITMSNCRLLEEGGRAHFMTQRFDRVGATGRLHYQSLNAIAEYDYNTPRAASYEQALQVMRRIGLSRPEIEQQVRRCIFNLVCRNQDDHTKNLGFLMDRRGTWTLAPAFDVTCAHNADGRWTNQHQMTVNMKADGFQREDLFALGVAADMTSTEVDQVINEVEAAGRQWSEFAEQAEVFPAQRRINDTFRTFSATGASI